MEEILWTKVSLGSSKGGGANVIDVKEKSILSSLQLCSLHFPLKNFSFQFL